MNKVGYRYLIATVVFTLGLASRASASHWSPENDPALFDKNYNYLYSDLAKMKDAKIEAHLIPWSETYWASKKGSINLRWNQEKTSGFSYVSPNAFQVRMMSLEELSHLSPSEKYDLAMGHYNYPLKQRVAKETADKKARAWEGICNGWSPAALQFREPKPVVIVNPDGISIPFGSSDVKGLISYFMAFEADVDVTQVGQRCTKKLNIFGSKDCSDVNAGALHVILTNEIGIKGQGFVMDEDPGPEIWNQPVFGYSYDELGTVKLENGNMGVKIQMDILYADELEKSLWQPVSGTDKFVLGTQSTEYVLELDKAGKIVGGEWTNKKIHPDFLWRLNNRPQFSGDFAGLTKIYQPIY